MAASFELPVPWDDLAPSATGFTGSKVHFDTASGRIAVGSDHELHRRDLSALQLQCSWRYDPREDLGHHIYFRPELILLGHQGSEYRLIGKELHFGIETMAPRQENEQGYQDYWKPRRAQISALATAWQLGFHDRTQTSQSGERYTIDEAAIRKQHELPGAALLVRAARALETLQRDDQGCEVLDEANVGLDAPASRERIRDLILYQMELHSAMPAERLARYMQYLVQFETRDVLLRMLLANAADSSDGKRWAGVRALGVLGDARAVAPLRQMVPRYQIDIAAAAVRSLHQLGDTATLQTCVKWLADRQARMAERGGHILRLLPDLGGVELLLRGLESPTTLEGALAGLEECARDDVAVAVLRLVRNDTVRKPALRTLFTLGAVGYRSIMAGLTTSEDSAALTAIKEGWPSNFKDEPAWIEQLEALATGPSPRARAAARDRLKLIAE